MCSAGKRPAHKENPWLAVLAGVRERPAGSAYQVSGGWRIFASWREPSAGVSEVLPPWSARRNVFVMHPVTVTVVICLAECHQVSTVATEEPARNRFTPLKKREPNSTAMNETKLFGSTSSTTRASVQQWRRMFAVKCAVEAGRGALPESGLLSPVVTGYVSKSKNHTRPQDSPVIRQVQ